MRVQKSHSFQRFFAGCAQLIGVVPARAGELLINEQKGFFDDGQVESRRNRPRVEAPAFGTDQPNTIHVRKIQ